MQNNDIIVLVQKHYKQTYNQYLYMINGIKIASLLQKLFIKSYVNKTTNIFFMYINQDSYHVI